MNRRPNGLFDEIVKKFEKERDDFEQVRDHVESMLRSLQKQCPEVHSFKVRLKSAKSLRDKLNRQWEVATGKGKAFKITSENFYLKFNDLVGGRILHLNLSQFAQIHEAIMAEVQRNGYRLHKGMPQAKSWDPESKVYFSSLGINWVEKESLYTSVHYELTMPGRKPNRTFEIQVRTLAEELWGEIDHVYNYPHKTSSVAIREQILVLARTTSASTRLVDAIVRTAKSLSSSSSD
jgi:putative GTP pyrophosphokinase